MSILQSRTGMNLTLIYKRAIYDGNLRNDLLPGTGWSMVIPLLMYEQCRAIGR